MAANCNETWKIIIDVMSLNRSKIFEYDVNFERFFRSRFKKTNWPNFLKWLERRKAKPEDHLFLLFGE